ncbi:MAG: OmpA family protein [Bacteroidales bacterium]|nr:OmpA family protein [Bacteroidales bacterium]
MKKIILIVLIAITLTSVGQSVYIEKKDITPDGISSFGGVSYYNNQLYLLLSATVRLDGKVVEASEAKSISQKYKVWTIFRYDPELRELAKMDQIWETKNASANGFAIINDSTVVYSDVKSQLVSNDSYISSLLKKVNDVKFHYTDPFWDANRKRLYYASDFQGGRGGMDIWYIETEGIYAGIPVNAGEVNSSSNELSPAFRSDSMMFYVSNAKNQQYDIYMLGSEGFIVPESTRGVNEFFIAPKDKKNFFYVTSSGNKQSLVEGVLHIRKIENIEVIAPVVVEEVKKEVEPEPEIVTPAEINIEDTDFRIDNYFGVAKYNLTPIMQDSLNKIADMLQKDPSLSIVICGHSSPDGPEDLNMKLSALRANEAYKWLQGKGVAVNRIFRVYGGEYLYNNMLFSRMFSIFPVSESEMPSQMVAVPASVLGNAATIYKLFGTDSDESEYWRFVLRDKLPVDDKNMLLLPVSEIHFVKVGETLFSLAKQYGITVEKMKQVNGLKTDNVPVGKILYIPEN